MFIVPYSAFMYLVGVVRQKLLFAVFSILWL